MYSRQELYRSLGIEQTVYDFGEQIQRELKPRFEAIDDVAEYNQLKVIRAMQENRVSEACFASSSGYGYNDLGRDTLEDVYASAFHTESALVRPQIACGTHALAVALAGNLRPGDELLSPVGKPYDTLEEVIGIRPSNGSLAEYGVSYRQVDLNADGSFDYEGIRNALNDKTRLVTIQRSKGYQTRPTLSVARIGELIAFIRSLRPDVICMVDNCYGEFVETLEPTDVGADLIVGSLIKKSGRRAGADRRLYRGQKEFVENAAYRLTSPGLGKEVGATLGVNQAFYQGFFLAPTVVAGALKGAISQPISMKSWDLQLYRTVRKAGMISFRRSHSENRKGSSRSAKAFRLRLRSTAMYLLNPGRCRDMTVRSSWLPVHLYRGLPSS